MQWLDATPGASQRGTDGQNCPKASPKFFSFPFSTAIRKRNRLNTHPPGIFFPRGEVSPSLHPEGITLPPLRGYSKAVPVTPQANTPASGCNFGPFCHSACHSVMPCAKKKFVQNARSAKPGAFHKIFFQRIARRVSLGIRSCQCSCQSRPQLWLMFHFAQSAFRWNEKKKMLSPGSRKKVGAPTLGESTNVFFFPSGEKQCWATLTLQRRIKRKGRLKQ